MNTFRIFYLGGSKNFLEPMQTNLKVKKDGIHFGIPFIKSNREFIPWEKLLKVDLTSNIADKKVSFGKAIVGDIVFGPVGAILGGMSGGRTVERSLTIIYLNEQNELSSIHFDASRAIPLIIKKKIEGELMKRYGALDRTETTAS